MITNKSNISLPLAVWLLHDEYDYQSIPNYISATTLMKPLRHIILPPRVPPQDNQVDVEDFVARAMGTALHDSIEKAWTHGYSKSLRMLGYPESAIQQIYINPPDTFLKRIPGILPIYLEQRIFRDFEGFTVGGKYDLITEGMVQDIKSTTAYSWLFGGKDDDYRLQLSLYRWIDAAQPHPKITQDVGRINFIFTDWQKLQAKTNPDYPQKRVEHKEIALLSLKETESFVRSKLAQIAKHRNTPESQLPECTKEELWMGDPQYKYYADPTKTSGRSTKNFDSLAEATQHNNDKGKRGIVITVPAIPKRCGYCEAFPICTQKDKYKFT